MGKAAIRLSTHDRSRAGPFRDPDTCQAVSTGSPPKAEILKATPLWTSLKCGIFHSMKRKNLITIGIGIALLAAFPFVAPVALTTPDRATQTLLAQGYTEVRTTGYAYFDCGKGDLFATAFEATSPSGQRVEGAVCSGLLKGNTVRLD
jgi:hypothetical protein